MWKQIWKATVAFLCLTVLTGVVYPLLVTGLANLVFPEEARGSLIRNGRGQVVGSKLLGQPFEDPKYFWSRPSATTPAYNANASGGSNLGPTNPALTEAAKTRVDALRAVDPSNLAPIPVDLVTSSGSGLDPHISLAAASYQVERVARVRNVDSARIRRLVDEHTEGPSLGILGEPRVNVLELNLALDALYLVR